MSAKVRGITIEIGGDTSGLDKALGNVNKKINTTSKELKDVERLLKLDPGNTELLAQKQSLLADKTAECKTKLDALNHARDELKEKFGDNVPEEQMMALNREIISVEQELEKLNKQASNLKFESLDIAGEKLQAMGDKLQDVGGKIEDVGQKMMPVSLVLGAVGAKGVENFLDVDKTMTLANKTMEQSNKRLEEGVDWAKYLDDAMQSAAKNSVFGMSDAANATLNFARAGLDAKQSADALAPAMNLAAGEGGNLDTVSKGLIGTINAFHDSFENTSHYADVFAAACNNSQLDVNSLSDSVGNAAPIFATAGYGIEDLTLAIGLMGNANIGASEASNALKSGIMRLVSPAKSGAEALQSLGFTVGEGTDRAEELEKAQTKLEEATEHLYTKQLKYNEVLAKHGEGSSQAAKAHEDLTKASNKVEEAQRAVNGLMEEAMNDLDSMGNLMVDDEGKMRPFSDVLKVLGDKFRDLSEAEQIEMTDKIFGKNRGAAWIALVNPAPENIEDLQNAISDCAGTTQEMADAMQDGAAGSVEKLKSNIDVLTYNIGNSLAPTLLKVVEFIQKLVDKFNDLSPEQQELIVKIGLIVAAVGPLLIVIGNVVSAIGTVMSVLGTLFSFIAANPVVLIIAAIIAAIVGLAVLINKYSDEIMSVLQKVDDFLQGIFAKDWTEVFGPRLGELLNSFFANFKNIWDGIKKVLTGIVNFVKAVFAGDWKAAWEAVKQIFKGVFDALIGIAKAPINGVIGLINGLFNGINSIIEKVNSISFTNPFTGSTISCSFPTIGKIPYLASGGVLSSGSAVVGEAGPELLTMQNGNAVVQPLTGTNATTDLSTLTSLVTQCVDYLSQGTSFYLDGDTWVAGTYERMNKMLNLSMVRGNL